MRAFIAALAVVGVIGCTSSEPAMSDPTVSDPAQSDPVAVERSIGDVADEPGGSEPEVPPGIEKPVEPIVVSVPVESEKPQLHETLAEPDGELPPEP